jgi:hypothetical protein
MNLMIKNPGGVLTRFIVTIDQFHAEHGRFPNLIKAPRDVINDALEHCLTPLGAELFRKKIRLQAIADGTVIAADGTAQTEYGSHDEPTVPAVALNWLGLEAKPTTPVLPLKPLDPGSQIVYVLTNPAMPGLVKIGMTTQFEVEARMKQLFGTGVPVPFDCAFACQVKDAHEVEKALHFAFGNVRINPNREFFKIEPERIIVMLKLLKVDDVTMQVEQKIEAEATLADKESAQQMKDRRPHMKFFELGLPKKSILISRDGLAEAEVFDDRKVLFQGQVQSLTAATRKVLGLPEDYALQPSPHWTFNGKSLKKIYDEYHDSDVD